MSFRKISSLIKNERKWPLYIVEIFVIGGILINNFFLSNGIILDDVTPILSMKDLGYNDSQIEEISLKSYKNTDIYNLRVANTKDLSLDDYEFVHIKIFNVNDESATYDLLVDEMKATKKKEKELLLNSNNYKNEIDIDKEFYKLDKDKWNTEYAYSLYDYNNYPENKYYRNYIFLKKDNRVMIIEFQISFEINEQRVNVLKELINTDVFNN